METTRIIADAVGIQYQGITDQSGSAPASRLVNGLIVGEFGRGRFNQPMFITRDTLVQLGDESKPAYQTVADCLDTGVPGVWVMRVSSPDLIVETECVPTNFNIGFYAIYNAPYRIFYQINEQPIAYHDFIGQSSTTHDLFNDFFSSLSDENQNDYVVGSGGGLGYFQFLSGIVSGAVGNGDNQVTLRLLPHQPMPPEFTDAVAFIFSNGVSVHSCGIRNWPGV